MVSYRITYAYTNYLVLSLDQILCVSYYRIVLSYQYSPCSYRIAIPLHRPNRTGELFTMLTKEVIPVHDWLAGPAMSEHDGLEREIAESEGWRRGLTGQ